MYRCFLRRGRRSIEKLCPFSEESPPPPLSESLCIYIMSLANDGAGNTEVAAVAAMAAVEAAVHDTPSNIVDDPLDVGSTEVAPVSSYVFEGCSWGCIFFVGIWKAMKDQIPPEDLAVAKFGGSSSGTLGALGACLDKSAEEVRDLYESLAHVAETFGVFGYMSIFHEVVLRKWLPKGGSEWKQCVGRLHVNVTRFFCRSDVISDWTSNEDIVNAMHCSMHIPYYMSYIQPHRGYWGIDGGVSANTFLIDEHTIVVTASSKRGEVHPENPLSAMECFEPPSLERRDAIVAQAHTITIPTVRTKIDSKIVLNTYDTGDKAALAVSKPEHLHFAAVAFARRVVKYAFKYSLTASLWFGRCMEATGVLGPAAIAFGGFCVIMNHNKLLFARGMLYIITHSP